MKNKLCLLDEKMNYVKNISLKLNEATVGEDNLMEVFQIFLLTDIIQGEKQNLIDFNNPENSNFEEIKKIYQSFGLSNTLTKNIDNFKNNTIIPHIEISKTYNLYRLNFEHDVPIIIDTKSNGISSSEWVKNPFSTLKSVCANFNNFGKRDSYNKADVFFYEDTVKEQLYHYFQGHLTINEIIDYLNLAFEKNAFFPISLKLGKDKIDVHLYHYNKTKIDFKKISDDTIIAYNVDNSIREQPYAEIEYEHKNEKRGN